MLQIKEPGTQIGNLFKFYARQRQKRRVLSRAPVDHEIRVQEGYKEGVWRLLLLEWPGCNSGRQPARANDSKLPQHCVACNRLDFALLYLSAGGLGEKLMKSHKSQTSGRLCTLYELLCSALLCCALLQAAFNAVGPAVAADLKALKRHLALKRPGLNLNCSNN